MAAITLAEITYAQRDGLVTSPGHIRRIINVSFPTGANAGTNNAYVPGGIALDPKQLGCRFKVQRLVVIGCTPVTGNNNPDWFWNGNATVPTLVGFGNGAAGAPDAELPGTFTFATPQQIVVDAEGY